MQYSAILERDSLIEAESSVLPESLLQSGDRRHLDSLDSAQEFSIERLIEVYRLVELEDQEPGHYVFDDTCLRVA